MASYEDMSTSEVQRLARQRNKDALYEMAWRIPSGYGASPAEHCAWQDYWWEKAADAGHIEAKGRLARSLINRIFDVDDRNKAMGYFENLVRDLDSGKFAGNKDYEEDGIVAKLWLGIMLCQGFGIGERRDPIRGAKLIREADNGTEGFDGFSFRVLNTLAEVYGQGCAQKGGEPTIDDLRQAIAYQRKAINRFDQKKDDPNNRGHLQLANDYLKLMIERKGSKESLKDSTSFFGIDDSTVNPVFKEWQDRMMEVSPAAQQRINQDKAALSHLRQRLAREGW